LADHVGSAVGSRIGLPRENDQQSHPAGHTTEGVLTFDGDGCEQDG